jgi:hypothetical protein
MPGRCLQKPEDCGKRVAKDTNGKQRPVAEDLSEEHGAEGKKEQVGRQGFPFLLVP